MTAKGFTLLEVLVALAVLAVGLGAAIQAASSSVQSLAYQRDRTLAAWVAENIANEALLKTAPPSIGSIQRGTLAMAKQNWQWTLRTQATDDPDLRRLDISVGFADRPEISKLTAFMRVP